jgi:hypothetical protein
VTGVAAIGKGQHKTHMHNIRYGYTSKLYCFPLLEDLEKDELELIQITGEYMVIKKRLLLQVI